MGKNRSASGLTNVIQYDNNGNIAFVSGSTTLMQVSSSGAITTTGVISGSNALSASFSLNSALLNDTGSVGFATTGSLLTVSSSQQQISASLLQVSASQQQISASLLRISSSYASTGSNTFTGAQFISDTSNAISFTSTASLYSNGGLRVQGNSFVSGTAYFNNIVVYGTSSIQYITSSQVNVGSNIITVNTDTPSVRFGGLSVFDSGSTGLTGSIFWDSELNRWIYVNASGSGGGATYGGGMFISGPRNSVGIGCEQGTTACRLLVGQGGDHLTSSLVYHDSAKTCFYGTSYISSSGEAIFNSTVCALRFLWGSGSTESFLTTGGGNTAIGNGGTAGLTLYSSNNPRLTISATGDSTFTCRVYATGLSTNASLTMDCSAPLSFSGTGGYIYMYSRRSGISCGAILINNGTGQNLWFGEVGSSTYSFGLNPAGTDYTGTPVLNMDILNGRIGIGRISPSAKLEIEIPTTNTQGGCFAASSINLVDPTTVGAYSQITFGYPGGRCWAASYIGHVSTNAYSGGYGDLVFGTRNCGNDIQPTEKLRITSNNSIVGYSQWYTTYTKSLATSDGGTQTARIIEDSLGQWIQVGRFCAPGYTTIAGTWSSVRGLSTSLAQDAATEFSADWGGSKPTEIRIMGATDFCKWRETRTVDFIYRNIPGRPWCVFFNGGSTDGNIIVCGIARYGFNTCGNYDGFGRWNSYETCMIGMSDGAYTNPSSAYTSPTASVFNWNTTGDAKLSAGHVAGYAGQDSNWTTSFGYDDTVAHFNDVFPNQTSQGGAGVTMTSAVWILLKFN
jgi:hypothetical protein